jgi:hypothetical protein
LALELEEMIKRFENAIQKFFGSHVSEIEHFYFDNNLDMVRVKLVNGNYGDFNLSSKRVSYTGCSCSHAENKTFEMLYGYSPIDTGGGDTRNGTDIANAVKGVYFTFGAERLTRNMIALRVRAYAMSVPVDERTVYRWLKYARELFAVIRGLDIDTDD